MSEEKERVVKLKKAGANPHLEIFVGQQLGGSYSVDLTQPGAAPREIGKDNTKDNPPGVPDIFPLPGTPEQLAGSLIEVFALVYSLKDTNKGRYSFKVNVCQEHEGHENKWAGEFTKGRKGIHAKIRLTV